MHYSRARSFPLDGRYHGPVDESAGCEPRAVVMYLCFYFT